MSEEKEFNPLVFRAKLAEQAERYDEMVECMEGVVKKADKGILTTEERNLLSVAYKNVIGSRRAAWRIISSIEQKEENRTKTDTEKKLTIIKEYRAKVEAELDDICKNILFVLDTYLLDEKVTLKPECEVFYYKMKGDYCRYKAEYKKSEARDKEADKASEAYETAQSLATKEDSSLPSTHPIRLGLALNYSVFHYEIRNQPDEACKLAKKAFDDAIAELDNLSEDSYKDSTLIMQLLRDNLTLWTSDMQDGEGQAEDGQGDQ